MRFTMLAGSFALAAALLAGSPLAQAAPEVKHVQANGINIAYSEAGQGQPLVLLHGGGLTSAMWKNQVEALSAQYRVIMPDTRGHGGTDNPSHQFGYRLLADDVVAFCQAVHAEKPIVMGLSDGGITTMTVGVFHPGFAKALVIGAAVPPWKKADREHYFEGMKAYYAPVTKRTALTDADVDAMFKAAPETWDFFAKMHAKPDNPNYIRTLMKDVWLTWSNPKSYAYTPEQLKKIDVPALVILGDHDEFFQAQTAALLAARLPKGELAVIPGAKHDAFRAKPAVYNALLMDFLGRLPK